MTKFLERIYDGLVSSPFNTVGALIIFLLAMPLIRSGLREKPPAPAQPPTQPIEVESPWMIQNLTRMQMDIEGMKDRLGLISSQISGVATLLKRRQARKAKPPKS